MLRISVRVVLLCFVTTVLLLATAPSEIDKYWPQFRGPSGNGVATSGSPPGEWSETKNVKWKTAIPGKGASSPIVWGDLIFLTTAVPTNRDAPSEAATGGRIAPREQDFVVFAVRRKDGEVSWKTKVRTERPHEGTHRTGTWASNSIVTDGKHVYAFFGSRGLYCLDMSGEIKWEKDFGDMTIHMSWGEGSSPVLYDDKILIQWDHEGPSFLFALDKFTGEEIWKVARQEGTSWSTPLIVEHDGTRQVVTSASNKVRSYDPDNGRLIWECEGLGRNVIPAPVVVDGIVIVMSGHREPALLAIDLRKARGNITGSDAVVWSLDRDTPYTPSPLLYEETLYFLKRNSGVLFALNAKTGKKLYESQRLVGIGDVYSSLVGVDGRVYISDRDGKTLVIRHGSEFEILATNSLDDTIDATPAIVDNQIIIRGQKSLYCIDRTD